MALDIIDFIEARISEDAYAAREQIALDRPFREDKNIEVTYGWSMFASHVNGGRSTSYSNGAPSPDQVLRLCSSLRSIVDLHGLNETRRFSDGTTGSCDECSSYCQDCWEMERWPCQTVLDVASIWSDHADFAPEWVS